MRRDPKEYRLYNVLFPVWMLLLFPQVWLVVLPGNFLIDSIVLLLGLAYLKREEKKARYWQYIFKIYGFGLLADAIAAAVLLLMVAVFELGIMGDELYLTGPAVLLAAALIFLLNYYVTFRKAEARERRFLSLLFAVATAPYTFLIPTGWLYG